MTKRHITIELNVDNDEADEAFKRWLEVSGLTWKIPESEGEPYKAFVPSEDGGKLIATAISRHMDQGFKTDGQQLQDLRNAIQKMASDRRWHLHTNYLPDQIVALVDHAEREGNNAVREMKSLLENLISHLRALEIVASMVGNGNTHAEKNARLRGLIEVLQTAIHRATEFSYDFSWKHWGNYNDLFKSDFPMRDVVRKMNEKDAEIRRLKILAGEGEAEPASETDSF